MDTQRLAIERAAITKCYPDLVEKHDAAVPTFEGPIHIDGAVYLVRLVFSPGFPKLPPEIGEIQQPGGALTHPEWGMHRFQDGTICLFPHGNDPQAWHQHRRGAEGIDRFVELKRRELAAREEPERALFRAPWRLVVPPRLGQMLLFPGSHGSLNLCSSPKGGDKFVDAVQLDYPQLPPPKERSLSPWLAALSQTNSIPWIHQAFDGRPWGEIARSTAALDENLRKVLPTALYEHFRGARALVLVRESTAGEANLILLEKDPGNIGALYTPEVIMAEPEDLYYQRIDGVMNDRDKLAMATAVMVGLGSLGAAVTLALARAGVRRFALVDPDRLALDNVCRHVGTLADVGSLKVNVIQEAILAVNPAAEIETIPKPFGWDLPGFSAGVEVDRLVARGGPVLLISTCAVARVESQLNDLIVQRNVSAVFGAVMGAAEHARVFRVIPGKTACYTCIVAVQDREPRKHPRFSSDTPGQQPYDDPSLPGLGIDITMSAMIVARMALQELARLVGCDANLGQDDSHILWTNSGGWIFDRPQQSCAERIPRDRECPTCRDSREMTTTFMSG